MRRHNRDLLVGGVIILVGVLILFQNMGLFGAADELIWAVVFGAGGLACLGAASRTAARWWALIPGAALLSLGVVAGLDALAPAVGAAWGGPIFLGGLSLGFWGVYLLRRGFWWAVIPGGVLLTLAFVAGLGEGLPDSLSGAVFFFGLAATFGLVAILPSEGGPRRWAFIPSAMLAVLALAALAGMPDLMNIGWPLLLILFGLGVLYRSWRRPEPDGERAAHKPL